MRLSAPLVGLLLLTVACSDDPPPPPVADPPPAAEPPPATEAAAEATATATRVPTEATRISARHILVTHAGSQGVGTGTARDAAAARALAEQIHRQLTAEGADFEALARQHSGDATANLGGHLGAFERGAMQPEFERVAFGLAENQISSVVETPFGFHIIQRLPLQEVRLAHVLVQWAGLPQAKTDRTPEEARALAQDALQKLQAGASIDEVARSFSDGPTAPHGGELGWFQRGQMVPAFDAAAFALQPGQLSGIVESPLGYHILLRLE